MQTREEIVEAALAAAEQGDWDEVTACLKRALFHLPFFSWTVNNETWTDEELTEVCRPIGDAIFRKAGIDMMREIWYRIDEALSGPASKPLEQFWDGCANGYWRA